LDHRIAWYEEHCRSNYPIFVAQSQALQGRVVGWSALNPFHNRMGYRFTTENSIYVAADQRGKGIGKLLMPPLIDAAKERGLRAIIAAIDAENEASIRLHAQFGFKRVGFLKQVGYKFDRWLDIIYMERLV
jgi:L-amino acid N-acyltransferase